MSHTKKSAKLQRKTVTAYSFVPAEADEAASRAKLLQSRDWPVPPRPLKKSDFALLGELALLTLPVAFLALAATAYGFHETPISDAGANLQRVMLLGPTLFPLAFAALGGRSLKNIALWKAQRGSTIGTLENLHGSQSFVSAIGLIISLRSFSILSCSILVLWSLSPLGGQSSLRLLSEANNTDITTQGIFYPDEEAPSWTYDRGGWDIGYVNQVSAIVSSSILTADTLRNSTVDTWTHPKVPRFRDLELSSLDDKVHPWIEMQDTSATAYTSLNGLSIVALRAGSITNVTIPYEYMYADCKVHMRGSAKDVKAFFDTEFDLRNAETSRLLPYGWPYTPQNATDAYTQLFNVSYMTIDATYFYRSSFFLVSPQNQSTPWATTRHVFYGTKNTSADRNMSLYKCGLHVVDVDANIVCDSVTCRTTRVRRTNPPRPQITSPPTKNITFGHEPWKVLTYEFLLQSFLQYIPSIGGMVSHASAHPIDSYIYGNLTSRGARPLYFEPMTLSITRNWSTVPDEQVSQRLTEILNTYWEASRWLDTTTRTDPFGLASLDKTYRKPFVEIWLKEKNATITREIPIYKASLAWVLTLILCSGTLFILGVANVVVARQTVMPDILGAVSSLTRDNPQVDLPLLNSSLEGMERTRLTKGARVRLGDVQSEEEVGRIGLRSMGADEVIGGAKVEKNRLYI